MRILKRVSALVLSAVIALTAASGIAYAFTGGGGITSSTDVFVMSDGDLQSTAQTTSTAQYIANHGLVQIHAINAVSSTTATLTVLTQYSLQPGLCSRATRFFDGADITTTSSFTVAANSQGGYEFITNGRCVRVVLSWSNTVSNSTPIVWLRGINRN